MFLAARTRFAWLRHVVRQRWTYVVGVVGLVVSLATLSFSSLLSGAAAVVGLVTGVVGLVVDRRTWVRARQDLHIRPSEARPRERWTPAGELVRAGYVVDRTVVPMLYSPSVNAALRAGADVGFERLPRRVPRQPSGVCAAVILHRRFRSGAVLFDGAKVSLVDDLQVSGDGLAPVRLREARYFDGLITNEFGAEEIRGRGGQVLFRGDSLFVDDERILPLAQSSGSNGIGVSTLALTSDGVLVIGRQGQRSAVAADLLAPSGSGSADWSDALGTDSLRSFVVAVAERELLEECGLPPQTPRTTEVLAFARLLDRGGKPEFFCFTELGATFEDVRVRRQERLLMFEHEPLRIDDPEAFRAEVAEFFDEHRSGLAPVLAAHALFVDQALSAGWRPVRSAA